MATHVIRFGDHEKYKQAIMVLLDVPASRTGIPDLKMVVSDEHVRALQHANIDYVDLTQAVNNGSSSHESRRHEKGDRPAEGRTATTPTILTEPILVANLPLPPEVEELLARDCRARGFTRSEREGVEEDVKLSHHYAGHFVMATAGPRGLQIHAIDLEDPNEVFKLRQRLQGEGHRHVFSLYPAPWRDPEVSMVTLNSLS